MTDPIADMINRIKNGMGSHKENVDIPHSKMKEAVISLLCAEGYIGKFEVLSRMNRKYIRVNLKYRKNKQNVIVDIRRVSRPGRKVYAGSKLLPRVQSGYGMSIVSTSKGIMTDEQARASKLGGEIVCQVW